MLEWFADLATLSSNIVRIKVFRKSHKLFPLQKKKNLLVNFASVCKKVSSQYNFTQLKPVKLLFLVITKKFLWQLKLPGLGSLSWTPISCAKDVYVYKAIKCHMLFGWYHFAWYLDTYWIIPNKMLHLKVLIF